MESKVISGRLELDVTENSYGITVYTVELCNRSGDSLYSQIAEFLDEHVKITIEKLPSNAEW
ncbi:hypothetical protein [Bacillus cereus group sp. MYBK35-2]|uniref:hypothetical protein n=1 Tax=unclassified Bacillus cereus group TaxID=2750818 RepID=UPI001A1B5ADF|nr:hypothetical protein [Vibrio cholerae]MDA2309887.1 hypothetical protein [Bacillus cereus]MDA2314621.1 hypothetical protein [Bacillus cereus]MDA2499387.1 hypothetical protein [Bacillus cereus]